MSHSNDLKAECLRMIAADMSHREISKQLGVALGTVSAWRNESNKGHYGGNEPLSGEIGTITEPIKTIAELLEYAGVDTEEWEVTKQVVNCWGDKYQAKAWLAPRAEVPIIEAIKSLNAWKPEAIKFDHKPGNVCAVLSIFDHHFGKLAWNAETNSDYDLKIASDLFNKAGSQLLQKIEGFSVEKIIFPLGSDFLHIDNTQNTTTGGTQQDVDSRLFKIYEVAKKCVIQLIVECLKIAPVEVVYVPGNHDFTVSWYMTDTVKSWFRNTSEVTVCTSPRSRKYIDYGVNLIGLTHGDTVKPERLALLIMDDNKEVLQGKQYLEWLTGHYHKKAEKQFHAGESFGSVVVKSIPSLCGTDAWHYQHGFVNSRRAAEIHLYDKHEGPAGSFPVHIGNI